jgi:hypothetical protein
MKINFLFFFVCRLLTEFIDTFFRENARRALARDPPLTVREAKERWTDMLEKRNAYYHKPAIRSDSSRPDGSSRGRGGKRGGGANPPRGGNMTKGKGAKFNGDAVCYHYNRAVGCSRTPKGAGCCNGNGGVFAHVCNHEVSPGTYCLAKHPKAGNH